MDAGLFRYKIQLNLKTFSQESDYGGFTDAITNVDKYASIKWVQAKEKLSGGILSSVRQAVFTIRYDSVVKSVNAKDTITYDNDIFDIQGVSYKGQGNKAYIEIIGQTKE
jgi:SPP1 family predicted phage head-tail adaptor